MQSTSAARVGATMVQNAMRAMPPGAIRTLWRRAKTGSSTVPVVFESARPSIAANGFLRLPLRPRNRALSVSISTGLIVSPSTTARCAAQISGSVDARLRRVATIDSISERYSVCTNSLENTGCARSAACVAKASSAYEVTSISRACLPSFTTEIWRTSALSSPETSTSITVVNAPSRRVKTARSSLKMTSYSSGFTPHG
jgi:hypothetical protein